MCGVPSLSLDFHLGKISTSPSSKVLIFQFCLTAPTPRNWPQSLSSQLLAAVCPWRFQNEDQAGIKTRAWSAFTQGLAFLPQDLGFRWTGVHLVLC